MKILHTDSFRKDFQHLPVQIQKQAEKQLSLFISNPRHPSLNAKKMEGFQNLWEGRITRAYRFTYRVMADTYILSRIGTHNILKRP